MINKSVQFLADEINKYLNSKLPVGNITGPVLVAGNIALSTDSTVPIPELKNKAL